MVEQYLRCRVYRNLAHLSVEVVLKPMKKISGRSWSLLGFSNPLCGQELCSPQLQAWVGQDRPLTTEQWDSLHLT